MNLRFPAVAPGAIGALVFAVVLLILPGTAVGADSAKVTTAPTAERLVLHYVNGSIELVSRTSLNKVVPPSVELPESQNGVRGNWFELQDSDGKVVYRRRMAAPDIVYTEIPTEENPSQLSRAEIVVPDKTFSILVPIQSNANDLVLFGPPKGTKSRNQAAGEIGRIQLR